MDLFIVLLILHVLLMLNWSIYLPQQHHLSLKRQDLRHHPHRCQPEDCQLTKIQSSHPLTNKNMVRSPPDIKRKHKMTSCSNNSTTGKLEVRKILNKRSEKQRVAVLGLEKLVKLIRFITPTRCRQWRMNANTLDMLPSNVLQCIKSARNLAQHLKLNYSDVEQKVGTILMIQTHRKNRNKHLL